MTEHAAGWHAGDGVTGSGLEVEYRLSRAYRRPMLARFILMVVASAACQSAEILRPAAPAFGVFALYFGVGYLWRGRFRTRVTSQGIEIRGYFNHFVPWDQVRNIEVTGYGPRGMRLDDQFVSAAFGRGPTATSHIGTSDFVGAGSSTAPPLARITVCSG